MSSKNSKEFYRYLILALIVIDVLLVLYSCERRQSVNPVMNDIPGNRTTISAVKGSVLGYDKSMLDGGIRLDETAPARARNSWCQNPFSITNLTFTDGSKNDTNGRAVSLGSIGGNSVAVDGDMIYMVAGILDGPGGNGWDIYFFRSTNRGASFETPQIISKDWVKGHLGNQVEPGIAVDPDNGYIYFTYTDKSHRRPNVPNDSVFMRRSIDKGKSFSIPAINVGFTGYSCDQPCVSAGFSGFVRVVFRQKDSAGQSKLITRFSIDHGEHYYSSNSMNSPPLNYETPIIMSQSWKKHPDTVCLIWRQESSTEPDVQFMSSFDGGVSFTKPRGISGEGESEFAFLPRADFDSSGNIYCVYKVRSGSSARDSVMVSRGQYATLDYHFDVLGPINAVQDQVGDLDVLVTSSNDVYISWNQPDYKHVGAGQNIFVCRDVGQKYQFDSISFLPLTQSDGHNREMPRLSGNEEGDIFMLFRDTSNSPGGDILLTICNDI